MGWNRAQRRVSAMPTDVYRVYADDGSLLYVGASVNVFARMREHRRSAAWWPSAATGTVHRYSTRTVARAVEAAAIEVERPRFNVTHERAELSRDVPISQPIEVLTLFWENGEVWVDAS